MSTTREPIHPIIAARNRVFQLEHRYRRTSERIGDTADRLMAPAYVAGGTTLLATAVTVASDALPTWAMIAATATGFTLLTAPLQFAAVYVAIGATRVLRVHTAVLCASRVHSLHQVSPAAASAAWHTPAPYRPRSLRGRVRLRANTEEVAARRAADVLRQQLAGHGVDVETAALLSGLHVDHGVSLGGLLDILAELDAAQRTQALQLAFAASRSLRYLQEHGGENRANVARDTLVAYVRARPGSDQREAIARLWPTWAGSVESLLAASRSL